MLNCKPISVGHPGDARYTTPSHHPTTPRCKHQALLKFSKADKNAIFGSINIKRQGEKKVSVVRIFPDSHFGSFYPQNLVWDSQKLGERVLSYVYRIKSKIYFIYLWLCILIYLWSKGQDLSIFGQ